MPRINLTWNTVSWASGYRIHAGLLSGLYTEISSDIIPGSATSGYIDVSADGIWYLVVAAFDATGYEGFPSTPETVKETGAASPPVGTPVLSVR
jgi:hypothetical protein